MDALAMWRCFPLHTFLLAERLSPPVLFHDVFGRDPVRI
jgi:hypothetical protein